MRLVFLLFFVLGCTQPPAHVADAALPAPVSTPFDLAERGEAVVAVKITIPRPSSHYVEIEATYPTGGAAELDLYMPVWTPGSYLVREFARHVDRFEASTLEGQRLTVSKQRKNRVRIATGGAARIGVRYRVFARDLSVRTSFVDDELALLNGATLFFAVPDAEHAYDVSVVLPSAYARAVTTLEPHPSNDANRFVAPSFDVLIDSPIALGTPLTTEFVARDVTHTLATFGAAGPFDQERAARDLHTIVDAQIAMWRIAPYPRYVFFNFLVERGGGLEHASSNVSMSSRFATSTRKDYVDWLSLESHELFHAWNAKRLRPIELGPFDYEHEVYTRSLWIVEGVTSYYADLVLRRADLITQDEYLARLSSCIEEVETTPGRLEHSLADASLDAWIRYYRPDANARNAWISYYAKGCVVGWLLDARIRTASRGEKSLDDVMRAAYERYSGEHGYTEPQFRALASEVAGADLDPFFAAAVDGTGELDYGPALSQFGLELADENPSDAGAADAGTEEEREAAYLGVSPEVVRGRLVLTEVIAGSPASEAGLDVDDEVLAIAGFRVPPERDGLTERLTRYRAGDDVEVLVARRDRLLTVPVTLGRVPHPREKLGVVDSPSGVQMAARDRWLEGP